MKKRKSIAKIASRTGKKPATKIASQFAKKRPAPQPAAPVVHLATGRITPAEAASRARRMRAAIESVFTEQDMAHIWAVVVGRAKNGDLQATRMVQEYEGVTTREPAPESDGERPQSCPLSQMNFETERAPRALRITNAKTVKGDA